MDQVPGGLLLGGRSHTVIFDEALGKWFTLPHKLVPRRPQAALMTVAAELVRESAEGGACGQRGNATLDFRGGED